MIETESRRFAVLFSEKDLPASIKVYAGLIAMLVVLKMILAFAAVRAIVPAQAASLKWPFLMTVAILGLVGVWLSQKTGFPEMWDTRISPTQRLLIPAFIGLGGASIQALLYLIQPLGAMNVPFPFSIPFYLYGGIQTEIMFRLIPIPLLLWLISSLLLKNGYQAQVFWGVAIVVSLWEPLSMIGILQQMGMLKQPVVPMLMVGVSFGANLIGAYLFRKSGFLAPVTMRLSLYLIWHVVFGAIMQV